MLEDELKERHRIRDIIYGRLRELALKDSRGFAVVEIELRGILKEINREEMAK